jgi:hypothetical protein
LDSEFLMHEEPMTDEFDFNAEEEPIAEANPDWMSSLDEQPADEFAFDEEPIAEENPDWMNMLDEEPTAIEEPDWLSAVGAEDDLEQIQETVSDATYDEFGMQELEEEPVSVDMNEFTAFDENADEFVSEAHEVDEFMMEEEETALAEETPDWMTDLGIGAATAAGVAGVVAVTNNRDRANENADNAPDWLNAMVPGLDVDYENLPTDEIVEDEFVEDRRNREEFSASNQGFEWLNEIVDEETQSMTTLPAPLPARPVAPPPLRELAPDPVVNYGDKPLPPEPSFVNDKSVKSIPPAPTVPVTPLPLPEVAPVQQAARFIFSKLPAWMRVSPSAAVASKQDEEEEVTFDENEFDDFDFDDTDNKK